MLTALNGLLRDRIATGDLERTTQGMNVLLAPHFPAQSLAPLGSSGLIPFVSLAYSVLYRRTLDVLALFAAEDVLVTLAAMFLARTPMELLIGTSPQNAISRQATTLVRSWNTYLSRCRAGPLGSADRVQRVGSPLSLLSARGLAGPTAEWSLPRSEGAADPALGNQELRQSSNLCPPGRPVPHNPSLMRQRLRRTVRPGTC